MAAKAVMRLRLRDRRVRRAIRLFRRGEDLDALGHPEEAEQLATEARDLLRAAIRDYWIGELTVGRHASKLPSGVTLEMIALRLEINGWNAAEVAREFGVHQRLIQRIRVEILEDAAVHREERVVL